MSELPSPMFPSQRAKRFDTNNVPAADVQMMSGMGQPVMAPPKDKPTEVKTPDFIRRISGSLAADDANEAEDTAAIGED